MKIINQLINLYRRCKVVCEMCKGDNDIQTMIMTMGSGEIVVGKQVEAHIAKMKETAVQLPMLGEP